MKKFMKIIAFALICVVVSVFAVTVSAADIYDTSLPYSKDLLYGRSALAELENGNRHVELYDCIYKGIENRETEIDLKEFYMDFMLENITCGVVILAYRYDNPQHFWVDYGKEDNFTVYYNSKGDCYIKISYIDDVNKDTAKAEFKAAAEQLIIDAGVNNKMSQYEISLRLHDAVVKYVDYKAGSVNDHSAYGALIEGESVCEGYAELYQYLLYLCGIQSHAVTGDAGGPHMWNLVRIDGEYYMSDPTHSEVKDKPNVVSHEYFNVTTEKMRSEGRTFDDNGYDLPDCTATKAYYYNNYFYNMSNFKVQPNVENAITQLKYNGEARFHYNGSGSYSFSAFGEWCSSNIGSIVAGLKFVEGTTQITYSTLALGNEYILTIPNVDTVEPPIIPNIPNIAAVCCDTRITVKPNSVAGDVVICPVVSGTTLSATDIQDLLNNTAVEVKELVDGKVVTGSKLDYCGEEAIIAVKGDIDLDGELSVFDANIAQKGDSSFTAGYELQKMVSDIDGNETTDATDAQAIINQIVK